MPSCLASPPLTFIAYLVLAILFLAACGLFVYWQLVIAEGVYLGPRVVALLYDQVARRYNAIKHFEGQDEMWFLGAPLARILIGAPTPLVLDVACGTGRLPKTLLGQPEFAGKIIGLDASRGMLAEAARALGERVTWIWQHAEQLPFDAGAFDAVTCLEALEFMPNATRALTEMARVLRPGGVLLTSNRIGPWARWMPGHTMRTEALAQVLTGLGFEHVTRQAWQVEYDLVWARRGGEGFTSRGRLLPHILICPHCEQKLVRAADAWRCEMCARAYPISADGVIEMMKL